MFCFVFFHHYYYSYGVFLLLLFLFYRYVIHLFIYLQEHDNLSLDTTCNVSKTNVFSVDGRVCLSEKYRKVSNIRRTLVANKIVDHSDVVGASPVGAAPTTSSFST